MYTVRSIVNVLYTAIYCFVIYTEKFTRVLMFNTLIAPT